MTPSQSAEACGKRVAQRLVLDLLERLADEGLDQQRAGLRLGDAARLEIEQQILVDLAGGRAVAADHVVGEDLKLGLGIELGRSDSSSAPAICLPSVFCAPGGR